eukprot:CFRG7950T1
MAKSDKNKRNRYDTKDSLSISKATTSSLIARTFSSLRSYTNPRGHTGVHRNCTTTISSASSDDEVEGLSINCSSISIPIRDDAHSIKSDVGVCQSSILKVASKPDDQDNTNIVDSQSPTTTHTHTDADIDAVYKKNETITTVLSGDGESSIKSSLPSLSTTEVLRSRSFDSLNLTSKGEIGEIWSLEQVGVLSKVGEGSYGSVYKSKELATGDVIALKSISLEDAVKSNITSLGNEIDILKQCKHHNIVAYLGSFIESNKLWIAMEFCGGGSCSEVMQVLGEAFTESDIAWIMRESLTGLHHLHKMRKIHRDIKGGNILITESGHVKIADFGVAIPLQNTFAKANTFIGTPYWMAPEVIQGKPYDYSADIWSLGVTAIELAEILPPLASHHPMRVLFSIPNRPSPTLKETEAWSASFTDFIVCCLQKEPFKRSSIIELLHHEFITEKNLSKNHLIEVVENVVNTRRHGRTDSSNDTDLFRSLIFENDDAIPGLNALSLESTDSNLQRALYADTTMLSRIKESKVHPPVQNLQSMHGKLRSTGTWTAMSMRESEAEWDIKTITRPPSMKENRQVKAPSVQSASASNFSIHSPLSKNASNTKRLLGLGLRSEDTLETAQRLRQYRNEQHINFAKIIKFERLTESKVTTFGSDGEVETVRETQTDRTARLLHECLNRSRETVFSDDSIANIMQSTSVSLRVSGQNSLPVRRKQGLSANMKTGHKNVYNSLNAKQPSSIEFLQSRTSLANVRHLAVSNETLL